MDKKQTNVIEMKKNSLFTTIKTKSLNVVRMVYVEIRKFGTFCKLLGQMLYRGARNFFALSMDARLKQIKKFALHEWNYLKQHYVYYSVMFTIIALVAWSEHSWGLVVRTGILMAFGMMFDFLVLNA